MFNVTFLRIKYLETFVHALPLSMTNDVVSSELSLRSHGVSIYVTKD